MSYNDYGDEPRRPSRRATREPAGPAKVQGSTAAAILVFVAIVGFGIGALIGNSGGDDNPTATENDAGNAPAGSPANDQSADPENTEDEDGSDNGDGNENGDQEVVGGEGITMISQQDGGEVAGDESGTIEVQATLDSGEEGVTLRPQRSLDGGQTWEDFCDECIGETSGSGMYSTNFWSGRPGENLFRIVGPDGLASNPITVNVVQGDDEDSD